MTRGNARRVGSVGLWADGQRYTEIVCRSRHSRRVIERLRIDADGEVDLYFGDPVDTDGGTVIGEYGAPVSEDPDDHEGHRLVEQRRQRGPGKDRSTLEGAGPYDLGQRKYRLRCPSCRLDAQLSEQALARLAAQLHREDAREVELSNLAVRLSRQ